MNLELNYYKKRGYKNVEGWMSPFAMKAIIQFGHIQESESIFGPIVK